MREQLPGLLPRLYQQTVINQALIRTVDLGPFKHKIDDGLELRKAAFECMDVLLDKASDRLYLPDFIRHLQSGIEASAPPMPLPALQLTVHISSHDLMCGKTSLERHMRAGWV